MTAYVTLMGNAGSEVEVKTTQAGAPFARFSLASNHGEKLTDWYSVTVFGDLVPQAQKVSKGSRVTVVGRLTTSQGKDGKTYLNVRASDISATIKKEIQDEIPF